MTARIPLDYDAIESEMWKENATQVVSRLNKPDKDLLKRIQTYVTRFGYSAEAVESKIRDDEMFAATFAKEPRRTSFHERVAAEWLGDELGLAIDILPRKGVRAYYISSDGIVFTGLGEDQNKPSKSLDFKWVQNGITFYAMHKYTKEGGGNQDSQFI